MCVRPVSSSSSGMVPMGIVVEAIGLIGTGSKARPVNWTSCWTGLNDGIRTPPGDTRPGGVGEGLPGIGGAGVGSVGVRIGSVFSGSVGVRIPVVGIGGTGMFTDRRPVDPALGVGECLTGRSGVLMGGTDRRPGIGGSGVTEPVARDRRPVGGRTGVRTPGSGIGGIGVGIIFNAWLMRPVGLRDPRVPERLSRSRVPTVPTD